MGKTAVNSILLAKVPGQVADALQHIDRHDKFKQCRGDLQPVGDTGIAALHDGSGDA